MIAELPSPLVITIYKWVRIYASVKTCIVVFLQHCNQDHDRVQRDASYHDTVMLSLGPLAPVQGKWYVHFFISFHNIFTHVDDE